MCAQQLRSTDGGPVSRLAGERPLWMVDLVKALASQLIVLHHFVSYGPMVRAVSDYAPRLIDWLYEDGRLAVQAFLVVGGFLSARSLAPRLRELSLDPSGAALLRLAWHRYVRLLRPYLPALLLAIIFAAIARMLVTDPDTPAPPSFSQVLYHLLLINDIAGVDALSTGVWYVAIDMQLYCMLLLLLWAAQRLSALGVKKHAAGLFLLTVLAAVSLLWINRDESFEIWGVYFFGTYALGMMVYWASAGRSKYPWLAVLLLIYLLALAIEWRTRLVVAVLTAALLAIGHRSAYRPRYAAKAVTEWLSRISYSVFLIHYPVVLLVGSLFERLWPENGPMAIAGFLTAWLMTLALADRLHYGIEARRPAGR